LAEDNKSMGPGDQGLQDTVIKVYRTAKVVKGGRRFSFGALVAVGDRNGSVGVGYGKANEVPPAVEKAIKNAKKNLQGVELLGGTLPHAIRGKYGATSIDLIPASPGTGVIAGSTARAILECAGVRDVLTKIYGSTSAKNVANAVLDGLLKLHGQETMSSLRGVEVQAVKRW
jgi:small subunit ribosomal protein S5